MSKTRPLARRQRTAGWAGSARHPSERWGACGRRRGRPASGRRSLNGQVYSPTCRLRGSYHRSSYFSVHVVHDAHLARRTPSLAQSPQQREEDQRLLLHRCRRARHRQGRVRSFLVAARPPPLCPRVPGWFVPLSSSHSSSPVLTWPFALFLLSPSDSALVRDGGDGSVRPRKDRHRCRRRRAVRV